MLTSIFIVLARAIHVVSGVVWAGGIFLMAIVIVPLVARHGAEGAGRWLGMAGRRTGLAVATSAPLAILSGMYLFATLHPHDQSAGGVVLKTGAAAALLSAAVGVLFSRTAGRRLAQLTQPSAQQAAPSPEAAREMAALRTRIAVSARVAAALLGVTVLAMATYRYASAVL
ncbi:MAG TPA: hypothetical protein VGM15_08065 [Burkholderiaceae bacterium]